MEQPPSPSTPAPASATATTTTTAPPTTTTSNGASLTASQKKRLKQKKKKAAAAASTSSDSATAAPLPPSYEQQLAWCLRQLETTGETSAARLLSSAKLSRQQKEKCMRNHFGSDIPKRMADDALMQRARAALQRASVSCASSSSNDWDGELGTPKRLAPAKAMAIKSLFDTQHRFYRRKKKEPTTIPSLIETQCKKDATNETPREPGTPRKKLSETLKEADRSFAFNFSLDPETPKRDSKSSQPTLQASSLPPHTADLFHNRSKKDTFTFSFDL